MMRYADAAAGPAMSAEKKPDRADGRPRAAGVQHGFLRLPWSRDKSAWGNLMIPIA